MNRPAFPLMKCVVVLGPLVGALLPLATGCRPAGSSVLGVDPALEVVPIANLSPKVGEKVTVEGEMVEKCPVAGCWFVLKDGTGTLRVDTKSAGFVVVEVPLHSRLRVTGILGRQEATLELAAQGLRY